MVSVDARSGAQRNGANRSSAVLRSIEKKPMKNGNGINIGRQPPIGFIFSVRYNSIIAWFSFARSSP